MKKVLIIGLTTALFAGNINITACKGCHGQNFERKALGVSKIVKDMNTTEIVDALEGYKAGTFGGSMKGVMIGQVSKFSKDEIIQISKEIKDENKK